MRTRLKDGYIQIIEADAAQAAALKSWGQVTWNKKERRWEGLSSLELIERLDKLSDGPLSASVQAERARLEAVQKAVDAERVRPAQEVRPLCKYPVKKPLYTHQVRAANMALLTFGLIKPPLTNGKGGDAV